MKACTAQEGHAAHASYQSHARLVIVMEHGQLQVWNWSEVHPAREVDRYSEGAAGDYFYGGNSNACELDENANLTEILAESLNAQTGALTALPDSTARTFTDCLLKRLCYGLRPLQHVPWPLLHGSAASFSTPTPT